MIKKMLLIIVILMNLTFCGKKKSINKVEKESSISFKDSNGRVVNLEKAAERIVMIPSGAPAMLMALDGSADKLVGIGFKIKGILTEFFPKLLTIRNNFIEDRKLNIEELVKINPDLVISWGSSIGPNHKKNLNIMKKFNLKVATFNWNIEKDIIPGHIKTIANSINKMKKANKLIEWRTNIWNKLLPIVKKIPEKNLIKTLYFRYFKKNYVIQKSSTLKKFRIINTLLVNNKNDNWKPEIINVEQILKLNPEVILLSAFEKGMYPEDIYKNELFSEMKAVKNRKIYKMPYIGHKMSIAGSGSHEDPLTWMWMSMILYPNYFNYDLRKEIKNWYKMMYGKIPTESQIDELLCIKLNQNSKNYEKFSKN